MLEKNITWVEISKTAIRHNIKLLKSKLQPHTKFMAVVKSNAYGHGITEIAHIAEQSGVQWLGTVNLDEALQLRAKKIQIPILVLSYFTPEKLDTAVRMKIRLPVYGYSSALQLDAIAKKLHTKALVHIKIDTGTSRLGIPLTDAAHTIRRIAQLKNISVEGIFSHLADAENPNQRTTQAQLQAFESIITRLSAERIDIPLRHIACSAAALLNMRSHYSMVRFGISLYGLLSIESKRRESASANLPIPLRPALTWRTTVIQVKEISAGITVGYGCTYRAQRRMKIALLPVGYWDGYDRKLSNTAEVLIRGVRCPVRGRICMNLTMVDVSNLTRCKPGDIATILGRDHDDAITADELAEKVQTINYEIVTRINPLIPRIYI